MTITGDILLFFLGLLALILMGMAGRNILLAFSSSMLWFSLFLWLFFSNNPPLGITTDWAKILSWVFIMLTFVPWLLRMDVEIKSEAQGQSWRTWGAPPKGKTTPRAEEYRKLLRSRRK